MFFTFIALHWFGLIFNSNYVYLTARYNRFRRTFQFQWEFQWQNWKKKNFQQYNLVGRCYNHWVSTAELYSYISFQGYPIWPYLPRVVWWPDGPKWWGFCTPRPGRLPEGNLKGQGVQNPRPPHLYNHFFFFPITEGAGISQNKNISHHN